MLILKKMTSYLRPLIFFLLILPVTSFAASQLSGFLVEVNGQRAIIKPSSCHSIVKGDMIKIIDALSQTTKPFQGQIKAINFLGFKNNQQTDDDRGVMIDTAKDLIALWAKGDSKNQYTIRATSSGGAILGEACLETLDPQLNYIELTVNGRPMLVRDGEKVHLRTQDSLAVKTIHTNVPGNYRVGVSRGKDEKQRQEHLILARGGLPFAKVVLEIE